MEHRGITLDIARLGEIAAKVREGADELRDQIYEPPGASSRSSRPSSSDEVLFERLGLPTFRKGKTGWSTDRQVLRRLEDKHPIVPLVGRYRELVKLDNTYLSALPELVDERRAHPHDLRPDGRRDRPPVVARPEPPEHPRPDAARAGRSATRSPPPGPGAGELRLQPGRAADPRPLLGRADAPRRLPSRRGRAHRDRRRGLRHGAGRRRSARPATARRRSTSASSTASATSACPNSWGSPARTRASTSRPTSTAIRRSASSSTRPSLTPPRPAASPRCSAAAGRSRSWEPAPASSASSASGSPSTR